MAIPLTSVAPITSVPLTATPKPAIAGDGGAAFQSFLNSAIQRVETVRTDADVKVQRFLTGESQELHEVAIATQQAELSLELFQQVRNKVVAAYNEVMRMQM